MPFVFLLNAYQPDMMLALIHAELTLSDSDCRSESYYILMNTMKWHWSKKKLILKGERRCHESGSRLGDQGPLHKLTNMWYLCWASILRVTGLGAVRQQAITWANFDSDLCRHLASLGHNELNVRIQSDYTIWTYVSRFCEILR